MKTLKEFLIESHAIRHEHNDMMGRFGCDGGYLTYNMMCLIYPVSTKNCIEVDVLNVTNKRKGIGTELVKKLIEFAKKEGRTIVLYASPLDGTSVDDLIEFYKKCGFEHDDRTKDKHCLIYKVD